MASQPDENATLSITAFIVADTLCALQKTGKWKHLLDGIDVDAYRQSKKKAEANSWTLKLMSAVPAALKIWTINTLITARLAQHYALRKTTIRSWVEPLVASSRAQVVVLGAGHDFLAQTLAAKFSDVSFIELDRWNARKEYAGLTNIRFVQCDFVKESLAEVLRKSGFDVSLPSVFIAEGVLMYLSEAEVKLLFQEVKQLVGQSPCAFIFTAIRSTQEHTTLVGGIAKKIMSNNREMYQWAMDSEHIHDFLGAVGFKLEKTSLYNELHGLLNMKKSEGENIYCAIS